MKQCPQCGRQTKAQTRLCGPCHTEKYRATLAGAVCPSCGEVREKFVSPKTCTHCSHTARMKRWRGQCSKCGKVRALKSKERLCQTCLYEQAAMSPVMCPQCKRTAPPFLSGVCRSCYFMRSRLKNKYGLSAERYWEMREEQGDHCAICAQTMKKTPHVDHDHSTGVVRSLLCDQCNMGLGSFEDNPDRLRAAARYIEAHRSRKVA